MKVKYLLDTNIVSLVARKNRATMLQYERHLEACALASVVWHELRFGLAIMKEGVAKRQFTAFYETLALPILPYDKAAADHHASERARLKSCKFVDGQIASIAATQALVLVTANVDDFKAFKGFEIEDWTRKRGSG